MQKGYLSWFKLKEEEREIEKNFESSLKDKFIVKKDIYLKCKKGSFSQSMATLSPPYNVNHLTWSLLFMWHRVK